MGWGIYQILGSKYTHTHTDVRTTWSHDVYIFLYQGIAKLSLTYTIVPDFHNIWLRFTEHVESKKVSYYGSLLPYHVLRIYIHASSVTLSHFLI